jgi:hypothetical protein
MDSTLWLPATALLWVIVLGWCLWLLPRWSRPGLFFAVSVAEDFPESATAREILSFYRRWIVGATTAILAVGVLALSGPGELAAWTHLLLLLQLAAFTGVYLRARRRVLPHAARFEPEVRISQGPRRLPGGWPGQTGPFALLAAAGAWIAARRDGLPAEVPVHYGPDLAADAWAAPSWPTLLAPVLFGAATCAGLLLMAWGMLRWSRAPADPRQAEGLGLVLKVLLAGNYMVALVVVAVGAAMLQPTDAPLLVALLIVVPEALGLTLLAWLLVRFGRLQSASTGAGPLGDGTDDRHWKAGLVYYDPDDPTIFIEKRFGIGYTMNMARPATWWLLAAVVGLPLLVALLLGLLG